MAWWTWHVTVGADDQAHSYTLDGATIRYGRSTPFEQPDPPTLVADLLASETPPPALGAPVTVAVLVSGYSNSYADKYSDTFVRFTGRIVAVDYEPSVYRITAAGTGEQVNRVIGGDLPWPKENELARMSRILDRAYVPYRVDGLSRVTFQPRDIDARNLGEIGRGYAQQCAGLLTEDPDGTVVFLSAQRLAEPVSVYVPSLGTVLVDGFRASIDAGTVVNQVAVSYGPPVQGANGMEQAAYYAQDGESVAAYGPRYERVNTDLSDEWDAQEASVYYLGLRADPRWQVPSVTVVVGLEDGYDDVRAALDVRPGTECYLGDAPDGSPWTDYTGIVQGWVETVAAEEWRITFDLARPYPFGSVTWEEPNDNYWWQGQETAWEQVLTIDDLHEDDGPGIYTNDYQEVY